MRLRTLAEITGVLMFGAKFRNKILVVESKTLGCTEFLPLVRALSTSIKRLGCLFVASLQFMSARLKLKCPSPPLCVQLTLRLVCSALTV